MDDLLPVLEEKRAMVKQMELWAPLHPPEHGGMGLKLSESALIFEALGRTPLGLYTFGCNAPDAGNIEILHQFATGYQVEQFLDPLVRGEIRSCFSMTEVDMPGSNPVMMKPPPSRTETTMSSTATSGIPLRPTGRHSPSSWPSRTPRPLPIGRPA